MKFVALILIFLMSLCEPLASPQKDHDFSQLYKSELITPNALLNGTQSSDPHKFRKDSGFKTFVLPNNTLSFLRNPQFYSNKIHDFIANTRQHIKIYILLCSFII